MIIDMINRLDDWCQVVLPWILFPLGIGILGACVYMELYTRFFS